MEVTYTKHKIQKAKKFNDGKLVIKNLTMYLYDDQQKSVDQRNLKQLINYSEDELIDFPQHLVQLSDKEQATLLNNLKIKNNLRVVIPSIQSQQQPDTLEQPQQVFMDPKQPTTENQVSKQSPQKPQLKEATTLQQIQPIKKDQSSYDTKQDYNNLLKFLVTNKQLHLPKDPQILNQICNQFKQQINLETPKTMQQLFSNQLQLLTAEYLITITSNLIQAKYNNSNIYYQNLKKLYKGSITKQQFNLKYDSLNKQINKFSFKIELVEKIKYQKNDFIAVVSDYNSIYEINFFVITHYERKESTTIYLEPVSNCNNLCTVSQMNYMQKQQHYDQLKKDKHFKDNQVISQDIEFFHFDSFQNEYQLLMSLLECYNLNQFVNICPVISQNILLCYNSKYQINYLQQDSEFDDSFKLYKDSLKPIMIQDEQNILKIKQRLNSHQLYALEVVNNMILLKQNENKKKIHLLRGIFGSGKTQTIVSVIHQLFYQVNIHQFKILLVSITNTAVDNIIERIQKENIIQSNLIQRLGNGSTSEEINQLVNQDYNDNCFITATTCASVTKCKQKSFSLIIIDEASQMKISELLFIATNIKTHFLILCGDPAQLPPISEQHNQRQSVLQLLLNSKYQISNLWIQYRCNQYISQLSSQLFYNNQVEIVDASFWKLIYDSVCELKQEKSQENEVQQLQNNNIQKESNQELQQTRCKIKIISIEPDYQILPKLIPPISSIIVQQSKDSSYKGSRFNENEADQIFRYVNHIVESQQYMPSQIGIICPYKAQVNLLKKKFDNQVQISTVDSFQGNEKELIIISLTKSTDTNESLLNVFLDQGCRVNVALTRAKHHLVIFKSFSFNYSEKQYKLQKNDGFDGQSYWSILLQYCEKINTQFIGVQQFISNQMKICQKCFEISEKDELENYIKYTFSYKQFEIVQKEQKEFNEMIEQVVENDEDKQQFKNYQEQKKQDDNDVLIAIQNKYKSMQHGLKMLDCINHPDEIKLVQIQPKINNLDIEKRYSQINPRGFEILKMLDVRW